jgi:murein DD-endopeptidase MepM/ murein hydrolase activator NlpD
VTARTFRILSLALEKIHFSVNGLALDARVSRDDVLTVLNEYRDFFEVTALPPESGSNDRSESNAYYRLMPAGKDALLTRVTQLVPDEFKNQFRAYAGQDGPKREWTTLPAAESALKEAQEILETLGRLPQLVWLIWSKLNAFKQYLREAPNLGYRTPVEWVEEAASIMRSAQDIEHRLSAARPPSSVHNLIGESEYSVNKAEWEALSGAFQTHLDQKKSPLPDPASGAAASWAPPFRAFHLASEPINRAIVRLFPGGRRSWLRAIQQRFSDNFAFSTGLFAAATASLMAFWFHQRQELLKNKELTAQYEIELIKEQLVQSRPTRGPGAQAASPMMATCLAELASPQARKEEKFRKPIAAKVQSSVHAGVYEFEEGVTDEQVLAAENGIVAYVQKDTGKQDGLVLIRHADGYVTAYLHVERIQVKNCQSVSRGEPIAIAQEGAQSRGKQPPFRFVVRKDSRPANVALVGNGE